MSVSSKDNPKVRINVYLPRDLIERIDEEANKMATSRSGIISQRMNQFYLDMDTQQSLNAGMKALTGLDNRALTQVLLTEMLKMKG